jgi:hypothetical protein
VIILAAASTSPLRRYGSGPRQPLAERSGLPSPSGPALLIVTDANVRMVSGWEMHFPAADLSHWNIEAKSPDEFVLDQVGIDGRAVTACLQQIADSRTRPAQNIEDVLSQLERDGLVESVAALRAG